jgi:hypothetical protein
LWADRVITLASIAKERAEHKGKRNKKGGPVLGIQKAISKQTGKESTKSHAFGESNWGFSTRKYLRSINKNLKPESLNEAIEKAKAFATSKGSRGTYLYNMGRGLLVA